MYIRSDELIENYGITSYIRPFSKQLWQAILLSIIFIGICSSIQIYIQKRSKNFLINPIYQPVEAFTNQCKTILRKILLFKNINFDTFRWR